MNKLPIQTRVQILNMLREGSSMRSISRVCGVSINTVTKLLEDAGEAAAIYHHDTVRNVASKHVQADEIWSFSYTKNRNLPSAKAPPYGSGDVWTWTGIDADTKLIISWYVGDRHHGAAHGFLEDLQSRLANRVQLTTDGHKAYLSAMSDLNFDADYAMLIKIFGPAPASPVRYSPPQVVGTKTEVIWGDPDPAHINTSFAERQNLTMRMSMRRFKRLTNDFSKKFDNHCHALALYFFWYNFCRQHKTLRMTPAMAAGISQVALDMADLVIMVDTSERTALMEKRARRLAA
ncbi:MAG: DDE-type integrase/transposase/recombinase [Bauldia sp.]|nr:DDE-type integrase/transposase/recombinase [Bauldia sp.]